MNLKTKETKDTKPPSVIAYEKYLAELSQLRLHFKLKHDKTQKKAVTFSPSIRKMGSSFSIARTSPVKGSQFTPKAPIQRHLGQMYIDAFDTELGKQLAGVNQIHRGQSYGNVLSDIAEPRSPRRLFSELEEFPKIVAIAADTDFFTPMHIFTSRVATASCLNTMRNFRP